MPSTTRRLSRTTRTGPYNEPVNPTRGIPLVPPMEPPSLPKHFPFPSPPTDSDFFFDFVMALFAITGAGLQFLYLYRSVWWLPNSYTSTAMNFYLIDPNLAVLIVIIFLRRLYYQIGCKLISKVYSTVPDEDLNCFSKVTLLIFYVSIVGILSTIILGNRSKMDIVYLFYPITLYIPIFGLKIRPFFEVSSWCSNGIPPIHACSPNPVDVRRECEHLKANIFDRLRQIFFTATINAYYGSFIPCCFAQPELVYDRWWNIEHGAFIFLGSLTYSFAHMIPLKYCDIFHRAILHSGLWERIHTDRPMTLVVRDWRDDLLWPGGVVVRYNKMYWRAMGDCNCIVPGDKILSCAYNLFILPSYPLMLVAGFQLVLILYQLYNSIYGIYWYRVTAVSIMCFSNYYTFFKLVRDSSLSYMSYKPSEESDEDKEHRCDSQNVAGSCSRTIKIGKNVKVKTEELSNVILQEKTVSDDEKDFSDER